MLAMLGTTQYACVVLWPFITKWTTSFWAEPNEDPGWCQQVTLHCQTGSLTHLVSQVFVHPSPQGWMSPPDIQTTTCQLCFPCHLLTVPFSCSNGHHIFRPRIQILRRNRHQGWVWKPSLLCLLFCFTIKMLQLRLEIFGLFDLVQQIPNKHILHKS